MLLFFRSNTLEQFKYKFVCNTLKAQVWKTISWFFWSFWKKKSSFLVTTQFYLLSSLQKKVTPLRLLRWFKCNWDRVQHRIWFHRGGLFTPHKRVKPVIGLKCLHGVKKKDCIFTIPLSWSSYFNKMALLYYIEWKTVI